MNNTFIFKYARYPVGVAAGRKGTWGGRRAGAGRKPTLREPVSFTGDLEQSDLQALAEIAEQRGVSVAALVRAAVAAYLKRQRR
jgi:hypothetical protein